MSLAMVFALFSGRGLSRDAHIKLNENLFPNALLKNFVNASTIM